MGILVWRTTVVMRTLSSVKQKEEKRGYRSDIGVDGWPIDHKHPVYQIKAK